MNNPNGTRNPPVVYKKPIVFWRMSTMKLELHKSTYLRYFPNEISPLQNSMEGQGITQFSVTLTGDDVRHEIKEDALQAVIEAHPDMLNAEWRSSGFKFNTMNENMQRRILDRVIGMF